MYLHLVPRYFACLVGRLDRPDLDEVEKKKRGASSFCPFLIVYVLLFLLVGNGALSPSVITTLSSGWLSTVGPLY